MRGNLCRSSFPRRGGVISGNALVFGAEMTAFSREASGPAGNWLSFQESLPS